MMNLKDLVFTEKKLHFKKGNVIFKEQDEDSKKMYFIDSGRVKIVKKVGDSEATLAILDTGDFFGKLALITGTNVLPQRLPLRFVTFMLWTRKHLN